MVGTAGGRAGLHRPVTASDCPASLVEFQAGMQVNATGHDKEPDPFRRRDGIPRSLTKQRLSSCITLGKSGSKETNRSNSITLSDGSDDVSKNKDVFNQLSPYRQEPKRKRKETPEKKEVPNKLQELREALSSLGQSSKILKELVEKNPFTKNEIKKEITTLSRTIEVLTRKCYEWETYPKEIAQTVKETKRKMVDTIDTGCQTEVEYTNAQEKNTQRYRDQQVREDIIRVVETGEGFESVAEIIDKDWPEDIYGTVKITTGSPTQANKEWDVALVIDPRIGDKGPLKSMGNKYPEICELVEQGIQEGQLEYIQNVTRTSTSRRSTEESTKYIYLLPQDIDKGGVNDIRALHQMLVQLRELIHRQERKKLAIATQEGVNRDYVKKLIEYVFRGETIGIVYLITEQKEIGQTRENTLQYQSRKFDENVLQGK